MLTVMKARPIIFLDIDDVLCLNAPYSGFDVVQAFRGSRADKGNVLARAFSPGPVAALLKIHVRMASGVRYVISSSWRIHRSRNQFKELFEASGLQFVDDNMDMDHRWATKELTVRFARAAEITAWLSEHHQGEPFAIIDDRVSGDGLLRAAAAGEPTPALSPHVVLCELGHGLGEGNIEPILALLNARRGFRW